VSCALVVCALVTGTARAAVAPSTPQSRLFNVWLDMRLVTIFYPHTTSATLLSNLAKVAAQLHQPLPPIRFGETANDARRSRVGAVMIKRHPPRDTWILFTRSRSEVWRLVDDAQGRLKVARVTTS
jgi:hypothetical protein